MGAPQVKVTLYLEVVSSWCWWAEPAWSALRERYAGRAEFQWKIALLDAAALPKSAEQCRWYYRRSGTVMRSPYMLNPGWIEPGVKEYAAPNLIAEAAKDFGVTDDRARLAITEAALRRGEKVNHWNVAAAAAADRTGLNAEELVVRAMSAPVEARVRATTAEFHALKITQRPAFVFEDVIGDKVVFSGLVKPAPLFAAMDAMLEDCAAYEAHAAHFGDPPAS
jgi:predicted DsbA family dithiol-disulfide isomerase